MDSVRNVVKAHLEKHKFFDSLKTAVAKDPKMGKIDRNAVIERLKSEGVLSEIIQNLPTTSKKGGMGASASGSLSMSESASKGGVTHMPASRRRAMQNADIDPNKRYLSCTIVRGSAFVDFVNHSPDESLSISVSFLKNRFSTKRVPVSTDPVFDDTFLFEFKGDNDNIRFDPGMLVQLNQPLHITILKHKKNEKPRVIGTKNIDWRQILSCSQIEINAEIWPVSLAHKGSLGVVTISLDLVPLLTKP